MVENLLRMAFMEGPQGAGKTIATLHASTLGYRAVRGIPSGENLIKNTDTQNWQESLSFLEGLVNKGEPFVSDRSFWSLIVYKMRKRPEQAESAYELGSSIFRKRINGIDHKVIIIFASPETCVSRANLKSPVAITDVLESENEIKAYKGLLARLTDDGFKTFSILNDGMSKAEFLTQIESLLK